MIFCGLYSLAQGSVEEFGKNRVQYHNDFDNWWVYESQNFYTYWYGKGKNIGSVVMQTAEMDYKEIINLLEHRINDKIELIVYLDLTDLKQSNLGSEEVFSNKAGQTKIIGNKIFVYFDGNHQRLRKQIREGISTVYIDALLYGSNLQEIVQNAVLLNLPDWFKDGLISYIGEAWSPEINEELFELIQTLDKTKNDEDAFEKLAVENPKIIGHSMWHFIGQNYGKSTVANLLYLTRINRDLSQGFLYVLGSDVKEIEREWLEYYKSYYASYNTPDKTSRSSIITKAKVRENEKVTQLKLRPKRGDFVYVTNELGKYKVWLYDDKEKKRKLLHKGGHCNAFQETDYNYPIISWSDNGHFLFLIYEKRDVIHYSMIDVDDNEAEENIFPNDIHRIYDASLINLDELVFTGSNNGYSDLFKYQIKSRQFEKLTDDFYDEEDVSIVKVNGRQGVVFSSNRETELLIPRQRIDTVLPLGNYDLFFYDLSKGVKSPLTRLTSSPLTNEIQPRQMDKDALVFLSDKTGTWNRRILKLTDIIDEAPLPFGFDGEAISNDVKNTLLHDVIKNKAEVIETFREDDRVAISIRALSKDRTEESFINILTKDSTPAAVVDDSVQINYNLDYTDFFESPFGNRPKESTASSNKEVEVEYQDEIPQYKYQKHKQGKVPKFIYARSVASRLRFKLDYFTTNLDNSLLFGGLDSYAGTKQGYENPPLGILLKANLKDLFEDYEIEGGTRISTTFNGSEHFLLFADKKKQYDKHYALYRRSTKDVVTSGDYLGQRYRNSTFIALFQLRYPFDIFTSLRASATFRNDKYNILAGDLPSLIAPTLDEQRLGLKLEYVFDNTLDVDINIKNGTRYKVFSEVVKKFSIDFDPWNFDTDNGFMTVLGLDFRHYQRILKHSVYALRINSATTLGSEKIIFYLGGVNNWLFPSFNSATPFPPGDEYAYQTISPNLRGFEYNIRNGGTYFLINQEFRFPVVKYLTRKKVRFAPLRNLQISGFFDLGLAWFGSSPFGRDNPVNNVVLQNPTTKLDVLYYRDPLVMGLGWGIRTMVFGYFLKFDYAWGIETRKVQDPRLYLSLGLDF